MVNSNYYMMVRREEGKKGRRGLGAGEGVGAALLGLGLGCPGSTGGVGSVTQITVGNSPSALTRGSGPVCGGQCPHPGQTSPQAFCCPLRWSPGLPVRHAHASAGRSRRERCARPSPLPPPPEPPGDPAGKGAAAVGCRQRPWSPGCGDTWVLGTSSRAHGPSPADFADGNAALMLCPV